MASKEHNFNLNTRGSKLTYLTSGYEPSTAPISFVTAAGGIVKASAVGTNTITGLVFPIGEGTLAGAPYSDGDLPNQIGDPEEASYTLAHDDFFCTAADVTAGRTHLEDGVRSAVAVGDEKDGGAQKFINAVLDGAYVAYNSGVNQGSGLSSMTVTRGDLSLTNSAVKDITGIVNTYSRSYSVTFNYKQSGFVQDVNNNKTLPDIANDLDSEDGSGPF